MALDPKGLSPSDLKRQIRAAQDAEWRQGNLSWKLRPCQRVLYDSFQKATSRKVTWKVSRRYGKSFILCLIASEICLKNPNSIVHYAAPTQKMVKNILVPIMRTLFHDAPKELRPSWKKMEGLWRFPNGATIHMAGVDNQGADNLRGMESHCFILDEAAFMDALEYMLTDIALPQTLTTNGRILAASTPSRYPGHYFVDLCKEAEASGNYIHRTIYDSSTITQALIEEYMKESGGEQSPTWRREYLAEDSVDWTNAIIPEMTEFESKVAIQWEKPKFADEYTVMDLGWSPDFTFVVFAYYDFLAGRIVVEEELVIWRMTTDQLAEGIYEKERKVFGLHEHLFRGGKLLPREARTRAIKANPKAPRPFSRYSDIDKQIMHDLNVMHGLIFSAVRKPPGEQEAGINTLRMLVKQEQIVVLPRCKELRKHLKNGTWNEQHTDYKRIPGYGHFDGIDAARYLVRNIDRTHNPYPAGQGIGHQTHMIRRQSAHGLSNLFRPAGVSRGQA
jgi:hypothetical protein